jgi:hypothetical protein
MFAEIAAKYPAKQIEGSVKLGIPYREVGRESE